MNGSAPPLDHPKSLDHQWSTLPPNRPTSVRGPSRRPASVLVPLLVVAALWLLGHTTLAIIVAAIALAVTVASRVSSRLRAGVDRILGFLGYWAGRFLTFVLLGIVQLLIFVPASLWSRLSGCDPLAVSGHNDSASRWLSRPPQRRSLHQRPYADESYRRLAQPSAQPGSLRWIRGALGGLVLLLLADVALGSLLGALGNEDVADPTEHHAGFEPSAQEALATQAGSRELMLHLTRAGLGDLDPFTGWRFGPGVTYESPEVNIIDGARRTRSSSIDGERAEVWFFGGSTLYGSGQSDLATIPSVLVSLLDDAGVPINAVNFGHPAYANWQQVELLSRELSAQTRPLPDAVVFYDGFNDLVLQTHFGVHQEPTHLFFGAATEEPVTDERLAESLRSWWADHSAVALATGRIADLFDDEPTVQVADIDAAPIDTIDPVAAADAALMIHRRGVDHVQSLARGYGFDTLFFWQPYLYTKSPLTPAEQTLVGIPGYDTDVWLPMTERVRAGLGSDVIDLSGALDSVESSVYWDFVHTNELGAATIAAEIEPHLREVLSKRG